MRRSDATLVVVAIVLGFATFAGLFEVLRRPADEFAAPTGCKSHGVWAYDPQLHQWFTGYQCDEGVRVLVPSPPPFEGGVPQPGFKVPPPPAGNDYGA